MNTEFFAGSCRAYYGELTFLEAFQRTGRIVNIVCTRSKEFSAHPIVLNYLNTPHVYIWYVQLSCPPFSPSLFNLNQNGIRLIIHTSF